MELPTDPMAMRKPILIFSLAGFALSMICSVFFFSKVTERNRYVEELIDSALVGRNAETVEDTVILVSQEVYRRTNNQGLSTDQMDWYSRFESTSFLNMTSAVSLKYNAYGIGGHHVFGQCGTMTRVLLNALWMLNIDARKLQLMPDRARGLQGHTVMEFFSNGRWQVISPGDSSFVWRNPDGKIATVHEIQNDSDTFSQIYAFKPDYDASFDGCMNIRWEKLPDRLTRLIKFVRGTGGRKRPHKSR